MADKLRILVLDDHTENEEANVERINTAISETGIAGEVSRLEHTRVKQLIDVIGGIEPSGSSEDLSQLLLDLKDFQDYDVIFLDYQLRAFEDHAWLTAEDLAGVIRAFGGVRQVVILNRFHEVDFDLGMTGWGGTSADLHMNDRFLDNAGLWSLPDTSDQSGDISRFRPWYWPTLERSVRDTETCRLELESLDLATAPVLTHLDLDGRRSAALTHAALGALNPLSATPEKTTFADFLMYACTGLDEGVRRFLRDRLDHAVFKQAACRVIVSELRRWLTFMVLGPQDVIIDAPHLAQRMPWLLDGPIGSLATWNATVATEELRGFRTKLVENYRHAAKEQWFSRVVLWARDIQADEAIDDAFREFASDDNPDAVFQEDFSRFATTDESAEFTAAFSSIWSSRYISNAALNEGIVVYAPKVRLL